MIKVLVVPPGEEPFVRQVEPTLEALQELVLSDRFETVSLGGGLVLVCSENGKFDGSVPNRYVEGDLVHGQFFCCRVAGHSESSLTVHDVQVLAAMFTLRRRELV